MPILNISLCHPQAATLLPDLVQIIRTHTQQALHKKPEVTSIAVNVIPAELWWIGGQSLKAAKQNSIAVDIKVTDGTNSKADKAQFIRACYDDLSALLAPLHPVSYIHVHEVKADAYGYAGRTQEHRFITGDYSAP